MIFANPDGESIPGFAGDVRALHIMAVPDCYNGNRIIVAGSGIIENDVHCSGILRLSITRVIAIIPHW